MTQSIRAHRVRQLLELLGTSGEVAFEERRGHLVDGLRRLLGGSAALLILVEDYRPFGRPRVAALGASGFTDACRTSFLASVATASSEDPIIAIGARAAAGAYRRRQLVSDLQWYRTPWVCETLRRAELDDGIYALRGREGAAAAETMGVFRAPRDRYFTEEDRAIMDLASVEVHRLLRRPVAPAVADAIRGLPLRQGQTLERLCAGDSEKEIAHALGISHNTVHVYVKSLYRSFGARSRGELLARFIGREGGPRMRTS